MKHRIRKIVRDWSAAVLGVTALALGLGVYFREVESRRFDTRCPPEVTWGCGIRSPSASRRGRRCGGFTSTSSRPPAREDALYCLNAGTLDLALVQGGLSLERRTEARQVVPLHVEPLHLLVKGELHGEVSRQLAALRGKTVNVSQVGSGTYDLSLEVLRFAGLRSGLYALSLPTSLRSGGGVPMRAFSRRQPDRSSGPRAS